MVDLNMADSDIWVLDFETNNSPKAIRNKKTFVWLWDICQCGSFYHITGRTIDEFIHTIKKLKNAILYSHNLKFDGGFILDYILRAGWTYSYDRKLQPYTFSTLISDKRVFYNIRIGFETQNKKKTNIIEIRDSTKKLQGGVAQIAKDYGTPMLKGSIDYTKDREENYTPLPEEITYIHNDTEIVARALTELYVQGMTHMTSGSDSLNAFIDQIGKSTFNAIFPKLDIEIDDYIRDSYRGGVTMLREKFANKILDKPVYVYDVNSMYPHKMVEMPLPYGKPIYFKGVPNPTNKYPLFICKISVWCDLKPNMPAVILQKNTISFMNVQYLTTTNSMMIDLTLSSVDLELLYKCYDIYDIEYIDGYYFQASNQIFRQYIEPLYIQKSKETGGKKQAVKLKLNSLYGKFATNPRHAQRIPMLDPKTDMVVYGMTPVEIEDSVYTAVGVFVTSWARRDLFYTMIENWENVVYCDTDSLHLYDCPNPKRMEVDKYKLGAWDLEKIYTRSKYLAQKTYYGITENKEDIKIAGCPASARKYLSIEDFDFDVVLYPENIEDEDMEKILKNNPKKLIKIPEDDARLRPVTVSGGVVLQTVPFTLHRRA